MILVIVKSHYEEVMVVIAQVRGGAEDECNNQPILIVIMKQYAYLAKRVLWRNARFYAC